MIRFTGTCADGRPVLGFGLSRENCERLLKGEPIRLSLSDMGVEAELLIFAGKTDVELGMAVAKTLHCGADTTVRVDRSGTHPNRAPGPRPEDN